MNEVSVVIRVSDDNRIYRNIESLRGQKYKEIIVVQNGVPIDTKLEDYCREHNIQYFHFNDGNASKAYNWGVSVANGDIVVCSDSDAYFSSSFIDDVKKYAEHGFIKIGGRIYDEFGESSIVTNQACFMYKDDYIKITGHDEEFDEPYGTDVALCLKAEKFGIKRSTIPNAIYYHPITEHKRGFNVGKAEAKACKKYPGTIKVYRLIASDVVTLFRIVKHMIGLMIGSFI